MRLRPKRICNVPRSQIGIPVIPWRQRRGEGGGGGGGANTAKQLCEISMAGYIVYYHEI